MAKSKKANLVPLAGATAAVYARYSSSLQNDASIEQQFAECVKFAQEHDISIVATYEDRAMSGRDDKRPGFQKMMKAAENGEFTVLLAYKSNRLSRNMRQALTYEDKLFQAGVRVVYCKEEFGDNATGRFMLRMMMNMNQFYSENLSEDVIRGMRDTISKCKVVGSIPYGYRKGENSEYVIHEQEAEIVREIFDRFNKGESFARMAQEFNSRHLLTKYRRPFTRNSFDHILANERYTGVLTFQEMRIEGGIPAIISKEVFELAQKNLARDKTTRARKRGDADYFLTGKLFCGNCGGPMVGCSGYSQSGQEYFYYACQTKRREKTCKKKNVRKEFIEEEIARCVIETVMGEETIQWIADAAMDVAKKRREGSQLAHYEKCLADIKRQISNVVNALTAGLLVEELQQKMMELQAEKADLESKIAKEQKMKLNYNREEIVENLRKIASGNAKDKKFQRMLVIIFVRAVFLYEDYFKLYLEYGDKQSFIQIDLPRGGTHKIIEEEVLKDYCSAIATVTPP